MKIISNLGMALGISAILCLTSAAHALPILSEFYYDAPGADDGLSFVELAGLPGTSLEGFVIEGINGTNGAVGPTIVLSGAIGADGLFVVADRMTDGSSFVSGADLLANFDFQNGPDSVVLRNGDTVHDALGYGTFDPGEVFAGEGSAALDAAAGASLARVFADLDTDDNSRDFVIVDVPTPGGARFSVVPEPGAAILLGLGLSGLAAIGRDRSRFEGDGDPKLRLE